MEEEARALMLVGGGGGRNGVGTGRTIEAGARKAAGRRGVEEVVEVCWIMGRMGWKGVVVLAVMVEEEEGGGGGGRRGRTIEIVAGAKPPGFSPPLVDGG